LVASSLGVPVVAAQAPSNGQPTGHAKGIPTAPPVQPRDRVAVKSKWSANTRTYLNSDGSYTLESYADRANYQDTSGAWQQIDATLVAAVSGNYTMASKANDTGLVVSDKQAGNSLARLKVGSHLVSFRVPGYGDASASPLHPGRKPSGAGSRSLWSDPVSTIGANGGVVVPGSGNDGPVFLNPTTNGFEFGAVLTSAGSSSTYAYALDTGGLTAVIDPDGVTVDLVDTSASKKGSGAPIELQVAAPDVVDAGGLGSTEQDVSTYLVHAADPYYPVGVSSAAVGSLKRSEVLIVYKINPAWLSAAGRTYPVTFDPTVSTCFQSGNGSCNGGYYDTNIDSGKPTVSWSGYGLIRAGLDDRGNGLGLLRTLLIFGHANLVPTVGPFGSGVQVTSASLWVDEVNNYGSGSMGFIPGRVTQAWTPYNASWNASSGQAVMSPSDVGWSGCGHGTGFNCGLAMPVTDIVSSWYTANTAAQTPDYGFMLKSYNEGKYEIDAASGTVGTVGYRPQLSMTYTVPSVTVNGTPGAWTNSRNLSWNYNADGGSYQTGDYIELSTSSSFGSLVWNSGAISIPACTSCNYSIPPSVNLTDGQTYYWRVVATDGPAVSAPSAPGSFKWDGSVPGWNAFTAPTAATTYTHGSTFAFAWNAASDVAPIDHYSVTAQSASVASPGVCSTSWTTSTTSSFTATTDTLTSLTTNKCYRIGVQSFDVAGNSAPTAVYSNPVLVDTSAPSTPTVTASGTGVYGQPGTGNVFYKGSQSTGTINLTTSATDPESGIASFNVGSPSPATGWSVSGSGGTYSLGWSATTANQTTISVSSTNNAGLTSVNPTAVNLLRDSDAPTVGFRPFAVGGTAIPYPPFVASPSVTLSWAEADDSIPGATYGGSGVAGRSVSRLVAAVSPAAPSTCAGLTFTPDSTFSATPSVINGVATLSDMGLADGHCYEWQVTIWDNLNNTNATTSDPILRDASVPAVPSVSASGAGTYQSGQDVYVDTTTSGTLTLTSTGSQGISGIASSTFGALNNQQNLTGWAYTPGTVAGNPAPMTLGWLTTAVANGLDVSTTTKAGVNSPATTINLHPDNIPPTVSISPAPLSNARLGLSNYQSPAQTTVSWSASDAGSGVASETVVRQKALVVHTTGAGGVPTETCDGAAWANDTTWTPNGTGSADNSDLADGFCYRWVLTATDNVDQSALPQSNLGHSSSKTSGWILVDTTAPNASLGITSPVPGQPIVGNVTFTGIATDDEFTSYVIDYEAGPSHTNCIAPLATSTSPVSGGTLATWSTGSLTGVYTFCLTVTDAAGNSTSAYSTVYIDNTDRGSQARYGSVPFGLGGGWNAKVNVATGESSLSWTLFSIAGFGPAETLSLSYNSDDSHPEDNLASPFGQGWSSNLTQYLDVSQAAAGFVVWHGADGSEVPYGLINGSFVALPGHYEKLAALTSGGYQITYTDRSSLLFDANGRLTAFVDGYGQKLTLNWTANVTCPQGDPARGHRCRGQGHDDRFRERAHRVCDRLGRPSVELRLPDQPTRDHRSGRCQD
jgi:hypothetical protein